MKFKDYYRVMGLDRDATQSDIKRAYRTLARKYHPDVSVEADAEARFKEVGEAYAVLRDPEKRAAYDQLGAGFKSGQDFRPPPDWDQGFEFHRDFSGAGASEFSDFFESLFGHGARGFAGSGGRDFSLRGQDTHAKIVIDLEDAYHGRTRNFSLKHTDIGADGRPRVQVRNLKVRIPPGVCAGQHIRLARQGSVGVGKGEAGDLYLEVEFNPHPFYHLEGKDIYLDLPVAPWEAALGATIEVPTPKGAVKLKIPPNSQAGRRLRLKGRGLPGKDAGDMIAILKIVTPPASGDAGKAAYRAFAEAFEFSPRDSLRG
ncbi:MAG: DnaJ domain-containing protein [Gammaproteobacteria bacterium]|nr:DnaJ domain-containing protein [Gammaproteobacteria bacterium]